MISNKKGLNVTDSEKKQPKKPYQNPKLIIHGTVDKITGSNTTGTKQDINHQFS